MVNLLRFFLKKLDDQMTVKLNMVVATSGLFSTQSMNAHFGCEDKIITEKADVWDYGHVLFNLLNQDGYVDSSISDCPAFYGKLIRSCLDTSPLKRPSFKDIIGVLKTFMS
jgi:hypothetical protein